MGQVIKINTVFCTLNAKVPGTITVVEISDQYIFSGGFGLIYDCISINNIKPEMPLLIKILKNNKESESDIGYNTILNLQKKINVLLVNSKDYGYNNIFEIPALKAFPGFSFKGILNGSLVAGYSTMNLFQVGFISFDDVINGNGGERESFKILPFNKKFQYCFHLAKGFQILSDINYVHADINPKNIFINANSGELAIIDYDGGGIIDNPQDETLTHGKLDDGEWLAPEIYEKIELNQEANPTQDSDRWSVSIGFHYILFMYDPFFFIKEQSKKCKEAYLKANNFYPINLNDENVSENTAYIIESHENIIKNNVPDLIYQELVRNYEEGFFNVTRRFEYKKWIELLKKTQTPPKIKYFKSNKSFVLKGTYVKLSWDVAESIRINIDNRIGDVSFCGERTILIEENITYTLSATGHFGESDMSVDIIVFPIPLIEKIKIPTPGFERMQPVPLVFISPPIINVSVSLNKDNLIKIPIPVIKFSNDLIKIKPLPVKSLWSVSYLFNKIKKLITLNNHHDF